MKRTIYATDGEISLSRLSETGMHDYLKLYFGDDEIDDFIKGIAFKRSENNYSIYD